MRITSISLRRGYAQQNRSNKYAKEKREGLKAKACEVINVMKKLTIINSILVAIIIMLYMGVAKELNQITHENIAQNVVLCTYVDKLRLETGIYNSDCQEDIRQIGEL